MNKLLLFLFLLLISNTASAQNWKTFKYETGDLLFQDLDCGEVCNALKKVTPMSGDKHYTHVGMAYVIKDSVYVLEAHGQDVHLISLSKFMDRQLDSRGRPKVSVARVSAEHQLLTGRAVGFVLEKRGVAYDNDFTYGNDRYYNSELIFDAYKAANGGKPVFDTEPMSFNDLATSKTHALWKAYFNEIGVEVPEGRSSISPAALANDEMVEIVATFY